MIIIGPYNALYRSMVNNPNAVVYNLFCPINIGQKIDFIFPYNLPDGIIPGDKSYDLYMADYIMRNDNSFFAVLSILYNDYLGKSVYIVSDIKQNSISSEWIMYYVESLVKFVQVRYGIDINIIYEETDLPYCKETSYSILGRQQFQADKERLIYLGYDSFMANAELD